MCAETMVFLHSSVQVDNTIKRAAQHLGLNITFHADLNAFSVVPDEYCWCAATEKDRQNLVRLLNIVDNICEPHPIIIQPDFWETEAPHEEVMLSELPLPKMGDWTKYVVVDDIGSDSVKRDDTEDF